MFFNLVASGIYTANPNPTGANYYLLGISIGAGFIAFFFVIIGVVDLIQALAEEYYFPHQNTVPE